jgi:hypothetical protein
MFNNPITLQDIADADRATWWTTECPKCSADKSGELEYFRSLLATLEAGDTALAIESVEGAIETLQRVK